MEENTARRLAGSVFHWLSFQASCGREALFSESFLTQPIGEFLLAASSGQVAPEWTIPQLQSRGRGRPRQVDYALLSRNARRLTGAIEAKWVGSDGAISKQRIVDDLLRLELIRSAGGQHSHRYLLVAGKSKAVMRNLHEIRAKHEGQFVAFLPNLLPATVGGFMQVRVQTAQMPWFKYFRVFARKYSMDIPEAFRTKLIVDLDSDNIRVAVWRVASNSHRAVFMP